VKDGFFPQVIRLKNLARVNLRVVKVVLTAGLVSYRINTRIAHTVPPAINAHTITPCNIGFTHVFFNTCRDSPLPIRNSVSVSPACEAPTITLLNP
jgi:hypothetical protein